MFFLGFIAGVAATFVVLIALSTIELMRMWHDPEEW